MVVFFREDLQSISEMLGEWPMMTDTEAEKKEKREDQEENWKGTASATDFSLNPIIQSP